MIDPIYWQNRHQRALNELSRTTIASTEEQIIARLDELWNSGIYPSHEHLGLSCGKSRYEHIRSQWAKARGHRLQGRYGLQTFLRAPKPPATPKPKAERTEWQRINHILKRLEQRA